MTPIQAGLHFGSRLELSGVPVEAIRTAAVDDTDLVSGRASAKDRQAWNSVLDRQLIEWGRNPDSATGNEDDLVPPSDEVIALACQVVRVFRDAGEPPPLRVIPDGEGGIVFERRDGVFFSSLRVKADLSLWVLTFENGHLINRHRLV